MKKGQYFKLVGDYRGVVWDGRRWVRFDCDACVRRWGIATERLQGPMTDKANEAMKGPVTYRHVNGTHN